MMDTCYYTRLHREWKRSAICWINEPEDVETTVELVSKIVTEESSNITLFYGEGVTEDDTKKLLKLLEDKFPHQDISIVYGGQPVYYYIISIE